MRSPDPGGPPARARFGGIEAFGHGELAKSPLLESPREAGRAGAAGSRIVRGPEVEPGGNVPSAFRRERGGLPGGGDLHLEDVSLRRERRRRLVPVAEHEQERVGRRLQAAPVRLFEPGHGFTSENEAVRLEDGAARRLHLPVSREDDVGGGEVEGAPALQTPAQARVSVEDDVPVAHVEPARVRVRDEAGAERGHGAFRGEDALRGLVPERGRAHARLLALDPHVVEDAEGARPLDELGARRPHRYDPRARALLRLENDVLEAKEPFSLLLELHRLGGAHAVTAFGSAGFVVLEVPEAHRVALSSGLLEQRLGHGVTSALRAGAGLVVREEDEERERPGGGCDRRPGDLPAGHHPAAGTRSMTVRAGRPV